MKIKTIQQEIEEKAQTAQTRVELVSQMDDVIAEVMATDKRLFSIYKNWCNYGTWRVTFFANNNHFGNKLAEKLNAMSIITHDEDKDFTIEDFRKLIADVINEYAYDKWE